MSSDSKDTTTISCWDANGLVVSLTHTLGTPSGVIPPGTGFMLNGAMNWLDPRPGRPGSIAPGKRRFSSMSPTIVLEDGAPVLTIGAPGGAWIGVAIAQGLLNALDWGMDMQAAVMAPRFSATTNAIDISNRIPYRTERALRAMGYDVKRSPLSYAFAGLHGISCWNGALQGGADPQRDGYAAAVGSSCPPRTRPRPSPQRRRERLGRAPVGDRRRPRLEMLPAHPGERVVRARIRPGMDMRPPLRRLHHLGPSLRREELVLVGDVQQAAAR